MLKEVMAIVADDPIGYPALCRKAICRQLERLEEGRAETDIREQRGFEVDTQDKMVELRSGTVRSVNPG